MLLGRSYVVPDCVDLEALLLAERDVLERLVSGSTLLTAWLSDVLEAIRDGALDEPEEFEDLLVGLELEAVAFGFSCGRLAILLGLEPPDAGRSDARLRFLSHPPPLI